MEFKFEIGQVVYLGYHCGIIIERDRHFGSTPFSYNVYLVKNEHECSPYGEDVLSHFNNPLCYEHNIKMLYSDNKCQL